MDVKYNVYLHNGLYYWRKGRLPVLKSAFILFSYESILSELVLQCTAIISSIQWMCLSPQRYRSSCTSPNEYLLPFSVASIVTFFLHFDSSTEKCIKMFYKSSGLAFHSDFTLCVLGFILGFFEICHLSSFYSVVQKLSNFFVKFFCLSKCCHFVCNWYSLFM